MSLVLFPAWMGIIWPVRVCPTLGLLGVCLKSQRSSAAWEMTGCFCPALTSSLFIMSPHIGTPCKDTFHPGSKSAASCSCLRALGSLLPAARGRTRMGRQVDGEVWVLQNQPTSPLTGCQYHEKYWPTKRTVCKPDGKEDRTSPVLRALAPSMVMYVKR